MKLLFAGHKDRGLACLDAVASSGYDLVGVVGHANASGGPGERTVVSAGRDLGVPVFAPGDINDPSVVRELTTLGPDVFVLGGYGPILREAALAIAPRGTLNLHGGKLPEYRGSSPLNWVLINGEPSFTLSIIRADRGVDTGPVLFDRTFPIGLADTIADLHRIANAEFPGMLVDVLNQIASGSVIAREQDERLAAYYPLRFPDDGVILWDQLTAEQIHNRIRALTRPYPGAFTFVRGRRVMLHGSKPAVRRYHGEAGRIYLVNEHGLLVCASDRCLWITEASFADDGTNALPALKRYDTLATVRQLAVSRLGRPSQL